MSAVPPLLVMAAGGKPRLRRERIPVQKEIKLHVAVAKLLRDHCLPDWKWTHINRTAANARQGKIFRDMGAVAGWPDFILVSPYGSLRCLELKRAGGAPLDAQKDFRLWCIAHGVPHVVAWSIDQVGATMDSWGCLRIRFSL